MTRLPSHLIHSAPRSHSLGGNNLTNKAEQALTDAVEYNQKAAKERAKKVLRATLTPIPPFTSLYLPYISPTTNPPPTPDPPMRGLTPDPPTPNPTSNQTAASSRHDEDGLRLLGAAPGRDGNPGETSRKHQKKQRVSGQG